MKKGFTLLELIIVIVIIGVLATLGFAQYGRMVEGSRGAEARDVIGAMRKMALAFYTRWERDLTPPAPAVAITPADVGIGPTGIPAVCSPTHYFRYSISGVGDSTIIFHADRCDNAGKVPPPPGGVVIPDAVVLDCNFATGQDNWQFIAPY